MVFIGDYLCMAMFAAFPTTIMEAAFGRIHNNGGRLRRPPTVVESILVDGKAASIAIQVIPDGSRPQ